MSSSTSSSDEVPLLGPRRWYVIALIVGILALLELFTRRVLVASSKDLARFTTYAKRARTLDQTPGPRIAFVGNSMTDRGVDAKEFARLSGMSSDAFVADDSRADTWYWILERDFWKQNVSPDLVVINFRLQNLEDQADVDVGRLAQFFTTREDWPLLFDTQFVTLEQRADFVLSSYWSTYAVRDRIKERTLGLVPGYKPYVTAMNDANFRHEAAGGAPRTPSYAAFERLLARAESKKTRLLWIAFPTKQTSTAPVALPADILGSIARHGQRFLDLRGVPGLEATHYADPLHLTEEGKSVYTHILATELPALITAP